MPLDVAALGPGDVLAEKFRVVRRLGEGGMGAVFEVEHLLTRHHRALKLLHAHVSKNATAVQRFLREASAAGRIGNPHIAETFDAGQLATGEYYLVMEFLRGHTLGDHQEKLGRRLTAAEVVELIGQVCEAIEAAHVAGVVHRDLKPDNLFLIEVEGRPFVKVLDFGISKFDRELTAATPLTREGHMIGTPYYMSPEQFRGERQVDGRTDIYSLGIILYELTSGRRPYEGESLLELVAAISQGTPPALAQLRPDLPPALVRVIERAMSASRDARPPTAAALAAELRAALVGASLSSTAALAATIDPRSVRPLPAAPTPLGLAATVPTPVVLAQTPSGPSTPPPPSPSIPPSPRSRVAVGVGVGVVVTLLGGGSLWLLRSGQGTTVTTVTSAATREPDASTPDAPPSAPPLPVVSAATSASAARGASDALTAITSSAPSASVSARAPAASVAPPPVRPTGGESKTPPAVRSAAPGGIVKREDFLK